MCPHVISRKKEGKEGKPQQKIKECSSLLSFQFLSSHHLIYAHFGPLAVEARLAGGAEPAGRSLAQAGILVAPCNGNAEAAVTLVIYQFGNLRGEKIMYSARA